MANIRYNVDCPSCEASIPIRSTSMVGKKTDCPKCKYRFVVPEPPDEDGVESSKKGKKTAKKGGSKTLIYVGAGVGVLAVILLAVAGIYLAGGSDSKPNTASNTPVKPAVSPEASGDDKAKESGAGDPTAGGKTEDAPGTTAPKPNPKLKDVTNLLPNETTAVYRVNFDRLNSHATPLANAIFDTKVKDLFRNSMTFGADNLAVYIHCVVGPDRDTFGVFRTKSPIDETVVYNSLKIEKIPNGVKRGREMFLLKSNGFVDAVSQAFTTRTLTKMVGIDMPPVTQAEKDAAAKKQYAICVYDTQTIFLGELLNMERFLDDFGDNGFPPFKSELTTEEAAPPATAPTGPGGPDGPGGPARPGRPGAPGAGASEMSTRDGRHSTAVGYQLQRPSPGGPSGGPGGPGGPPPGMVPPGAPGATGGPGAAPAAPPRRLFTTVPTYRTIDPPLKKMLNVLEENETDPPAIVYAEKLDQRVLNGRQFLQVYQQTGSSAAALISRVQMVGGILNNLTQDKGDALIALEFVSDDDAKKTVAEAILPNLRVATPVVDALLGTSTQVKDNTGGDQGGNTPGGSGGPGGRPGGGFPGGSDGGPPGGGFPGGSGRGRPGGSPGGRSGPGGEGGDEGGFPGGQQQQRPGGFPGGNPSDGGTPSAINAGLIEINLADRLVTISATMKWPEDKFKSFLAPQITRLSGMMKGRMSVLNGDIEWHRLANVSNKLQDGKKAYPRGTLDRESGDTRYRLPFPPEQRCSFFVDLLPYIGQGPLRNQIQDKKFPWYAKENINAGETWIPEFLVPYYPQETWRASHPLAEGKSLGATNYVAPAGLGMDAGYYDPANPEMAKKIGITGYSWGSKPEEIKDGLSNTFYLLQAAPGTARPWIAGGGATNVGIDEADPMAAFVHRLPDGKRGTYALMADGSVRFLKEGTDPKLFMALVTRAGGESLTDLDKNAPKVAPTKGLETELRSGAVAGKALSIKEVEVSLEDLKPFQGTWRATFFKSKRLKDVPKDFLDQIKIEVTFDAKLIRAKVSGIPGKEEATSPPDEIVKFDAKAKAIDTRDDKGKITFDLYEFRGTDKLFIRSSDKARPTKTAVPDEKSDDDYLELERVK
jgi:hypothetical protein